MAEEKKVYRVYIDQDAAKFTTEAGDKVRVVRPEFYLGDYFIFQADVRNADLSVFEFPLDAVFFASLNAQLGQDDADEAASTDASFNLVEQRADIDLATGKISWEMNAASEALKTYMATATSKKVWLELWFKVPGGEYSKILHEQLKIYNSGSDFASVPVPTDDYSTTTEVQAMIAASKPSRIANIAALPASPDDLDEYFLTSVSSKVMWDGTEGNWIYSGTGATVNAGDEA